MTEPAACILSVSGVRLTEPEKRLLSDANPWGVILMGRSCESPAQVRALTDSICDATGRRTLILIDQEGGRVRRLRPPAWPDFPAPGVYGELYSTDRDAAREAAWLHHRLMAAELEAIGIRANCTPVVDIHHEGMHRIVGDRSFGSTPEIVTNLALAALEGLSAGGVVGVIKHTPGHGRAQVDSHESMPVVRASRELVDTDIEPFRRLSHAAAMAMTAHLAYTALDDETTPATLSPKIIGDVIRGQIGFDGLLMTDDLGMRALGGLLTSRAERALKAGCDVILHCAGLDAWGKVQRDPGAVLREMQEVAAACPRLSDEARRRAEAADLATGHVTPFDAAEGWARLERLLPGVPRASKASA